MVPKFLENAKKLGWLVISLDELIKKQYILDHLDGNHGNLYPRQEEFIDEGVKYISANSIVNGVIDFKKSKFLSQERADKFKKGVAKNGDVIFAHNATVGPVALLETNDEKVILSTSLTYYRVNSEKINGKYLVQYMSSPNFIRQYEAIMRQTTRNQLPITTQRDFLFIIPPIQEQKKIAEILSTWDKAIETVEKLVANSQQQKKALMQQLLTGQKRLLDDNGVKFEDEWEEYPLSQISNIIMGTSPKSESYNDFENGLPLIQGNADIKNRRSNPRIWNSEITKECQPKDILMSVRAPVGTIAISNHHACIGRGIASIKAKKEHSQDFIYHWLLWFEPKWVSFSQGSTFESINSDDIKSLKISVPTIKEQEKIAQVLTLADREIDLYKEQLDKLKLEKKSLMQQLLTGQKRVKF